MENKDQNLSFENEFLKLKLKAESGANIYESNLPPNVENEFLKYIMAFEEAAREKKVIKLFDKIHRPEFSLEIDESLLTSELERLLNHLEKHHIKVTTLCEVSDKELYRFIIQDLFEEIINDVPHMEGSFSCFTYEDFYPNHPYDISNRLEDFRQVLIKKEIGLYSWVFSEEFVSIDGNKLSEKEVTRQLENFFNGFHSISIPVFDCKELNIEGEDAVQKVFIKIETKDTSGRILEKLEGEGKIFFEYGFGWWSVSGIDIPGLRM